MKAVVFQIEARKNLRKLPPHIHEQIEAKLQHYAETGAGDVKSLQGMGGSRLRSGDYRVLFLETATTIEVFALGNRRDVYR